MQSELYDEVLSILSEILQLDFDIQEDQLSRREISEWDSINHLRFALELEERFGIAIKEDEWAVLGTLREVESLLSRELKTSSSESGKQGQE